MRVSEAEFDRLSKAYINGSITLDQFVEWTYDGDAAQMIADCETLLALDAIGEAHRLQCLTLRPKGN